MGCGRCECGRRSVRRVTQKVGVMQHSASCGTLGRQELVGKVVLWGGKQGEAGVWLAPHRACYGCGVALDVSAVAAELEPALGSGIVNRRLGTRIRCVLLEQKVRLAG